MTTFLDTLEASAKAATPQRIDTSEAVEQNGHTECPWCDGQGEVTADTYTNYDDCAIGVQFFGIGHEHVNAEKYFRLCSPSNILALVRVARASKRCISELQGLCVLADCMPDETAEVLTEIATALDALPK